MTNGKGIKVNMTGIASGTVALLWFYAALSKLGDFGHYQAAMQKQPFPPPIQQLLIWTLPSFELLTGAALLTGKYLKPGLYASAVLFGSFAAYIALILSRTFGHIPCSCGGLIEHMGWSFHLWFNLAFLALTLYIIWINQRKESGDTEE